MPRKKIFYFVVAIAICLLAGYAGSYYATPSIPTWFAGLQKPDIGPPPWVFDPLWIILGVLAGVSLYLIIQSGWETKGVKAGLFLFFFQMILNIVWMYSFFALHSTFFGLLSILLLWIVLLCTIIQVYQFSISAAMLLVPGFAWISLAVYLTYAIMVLNPATFGISV
jgi:translocator protein